MNKKHYIFISFAILLIIAFITFLYFQNKNTVYTKINENNSQIIEITDEIYKEENFVEILEIGEIIEEEILDKEKTGEILVPTKEFAILPNFINSKQEIELYYNSLNIEFADKIDKIILIGENNCDLAHDIISTPKIEKIFCYQSNCLDFVSLGDEEIVFESPNFIAKELENFSITNNGIGKHFQYLNKYFGEKEFYLLLLNPNNFENILKTKDYLNNLFENESVLFLTINDFSRLENEKFKKLHNTKTFYTLNNSFDLSEYENLEVSCASCLYLTNNLAFEASRFPHKFMEKDNFIYYHEVKNENNGITITFFGDLIFDRNVSLYIKNEEDFYRFFKDFFSDDDYSLDLNEYKTRKLFGQDFVGLNLETPVVSDLNECAYSEKSIKFCSKDVFLPWIKNLGFNTFALANNHTMDGGISAHNATIRNLENNNLNYFGYIRHGSYLEKNYVFTGSIRGIDFAWHSFDFTIYGDLSLNTFCETLQQYKENGYNNFVVTHWGNEYQYMEHNNTQERLGKKLVDCGANLIIGGHPHVIQDIEWYNGIPIIYSMGNFLFDQDWSENTQRGIGVLIDYNVTNQTISIDTEERNVAVKKNFES